MALTMNEAIERAAAIWGGRSSNVIELAPDGGAAVDTLTDVSGVTLSRYHRLDANGHVACHYECQEREKSLPSPPRRTLKLSELVDLVSRAASVIGESDGADEHAELLGELRAAAELARVALFTGDETLLDISHLDDEQEVR